MASQSRIGRVISIPVEGPITELTDVRFEFPHLHKKLFGNNGTSYIERVNPAGLAPINARLAETRVVMVVDEEGMLKHLPHNIRAGYLYGTQAHGTPVFGNAFILGEGDVFDEEWGPGVDFIGLPDGVTVKLIEDLIAIAATKAGLVEIANIDLPE